MREARGNAGRMEASTIDYASRIDFHRHGRRCVTILYGVN